MIGCLLRLYKRSYRQSQLKNRAYLIYEPISDTTRTATGDSTAPTSSSPLPTEYPTTPPSSPTPTTSQSETISSPELLEVLGRSHKAKKSSILLTNYLTNTVTATHPSHASHTPTAHDQSSPTTVLGKTLYPISDYSSTTTFSVKYQEFLVEITTDYVPKTYQEAVKDPRFNGAMKAEVTTLEENHTWDVTSLPPGKRAITCQWLYSMKYRVDGTLERPKARLVACGNRQRVCLDYKDTFAPVAKMNTVRFLLNVSAAKR